MTNISAAVRVALVAGALLVLPACAEEREAPTVLPAATSTPSPTPTPSAVDTPTASAAATPGQFDAATQADAEAFVEDFWSAVNAGLAAGSPDGIDDFYQSSCSVCQTIYDNVEELETLRERAEGADQKVIDTSYDDNNGSVAIISSVVQSQPGEVIASGGEVVRTVSGGPPSDYVFNVVQRPDGSWIIQDLLAFGPRES